MYELFTQTFDTSDFPPRWYCGNWSAVHGWTHIVGDFAIAGAYAAIPLVLMYFVLRRKDIPFLSIFWLFIAFILSCGIGHFIEACIFWHPVYRLSALVKACTAIVSWATVIALIPIIPNALTLPRLAQINERLRQEVAERERTGTQLQGSYDELQKFTQHLLDREDRIIELKEEVNKLLSASGQPARYSLAPRNK